MGKSPKSLSIMTETQRLAGPLSESEAGKKLRLLGDIVDMTDGRRHVLRLTFCFLEDQLGGSERRKDHGESNIQKHIWVQRNIWSQAVLLCGWKCGVHFIFDSGNEDPAMF